MQHRASSGYQDQSLREKLPPMAPHSARSRPHSARGAGPSKYKAAGRTLGPGTEDEPPAVRCAASNSTGCIPTQSAASDPSQENEFTLVSSHQDASNYEGSEYTKRYIEEIPYDGGYALLAKWELMEDRITKEIRQGLAALRQEAEQQRISVTEQVCRLQDSTSRALADLRGELRGDEVIAAVQGERQAIVEAVHNQVSEGSTRVAKEVQARAVQVVEAMQGIEPELQLVLEAISVSKNELRDKLATMVVEIREPILGALNFNPERGGVETDELLEEVGKLRAVHALNFADTCEELRSCKSEVLQEIRTCRIDANLLEGLHGIHHASLAARDEIENLKIGMAANSSCVCDEIVKSREAHSMAIEEKLRPLQNTVARIDVGEALRHVGDALHQTHDTHAAILRQLGYMTGVMPAAGIGESSSVVDGRERPMTVVS